MTCARLNLEENPEWEQPPRVVTKHCHRCGAPFRDRAGEPFVTCFSCRKPWVPDPAAPMQRPDDGWHGWRKPRHADPDETAGDWFDPDAAP